MEPINSQKDLYVDFLLDMYNAEILQITALRDYEKRTDNPKLKQLLHRHVSETRGQMLRLEDIVEGLDESLLHEHCRTMKSMIDETNELIDRCTTDELRDWAIAASVQRINHCEITVYEMLLSMAEFLEASKYIELLKKSLEEEISFENDIEELIDFQPV
ncbi:MAG: DUF892 family protein [Balneolaceae bacterium]|nr:DUF892 family protein [Balneolaceae bacterium]